MSWIETHIAPPQADLDANKAQEPEGERIRAELTEWLKRNRIVSVFLDTEKHHVSVESVNLPPHIKSVLTQWGSIFVEHE